MTLNNQKLYQLYNSSLHFLEPVCKEEMYHRIVEEGKKLVDGAYGTILLYKNGKLQREYVSSSLFSPVEPCSNGRTYKALKTKKPFIAEVKNPNDIIHPHLYHKGVKSIAYIPIMHKDQALGVLSIFKTNNHVIPDYSTLAKMLGSFINASITYNMCFEQKQIELNTRDLFISIAKHEIKTPLTTIAVYSQLLEKKLAKAQIAEKQLANNIQFEVERISSLTDDLLNIENIKAGELTYKNSLFCISEIINPAVRNFQTNFPRHKIVIKKKINIENIFLQGDSIKLIEAVTNILNNAGKFSQIPSSIIVAIDNDTDFVSIEIIDKGKGIAKKDLDKVFEKYYKGNNKNVGMGIGLFLTKKIISKHNGEITITSQRNKGTKVKITLPIEKCMRENQFQSLHQNIHLSKINILLANLAIVKAQMSQDTLLTQQERLSNLTPTFDSLQRIDNKENYGCQTPREFYGDILLDVLDGNRQKIAVIGPAGARKTTVIANLVTKLHTDLSILLKREPKIAVITIEDANIYVGRKFGRITTPHGQHTAESYDLIAHIDKEAISLAEKDHDIVIYEGIGITGFTLQKGDTDEEHRIGLDRGASVLRHVNKVLALTEAKETHDNSLEIRERIVGKPLSDQIKILKEYGIIIISPEDSEVPIPGGNPQGTQIIFDAINECLDTLVTEDFLPVRNYLLKQFIKQHLPSIFNLAPNWRGKFLGKEFYPWYLQREHFNSGNVLIAQANPHQKFTVVNLKLLEQCLYIRHLSDEQQRSLLPPEQL